MKKLLFFAESVSLAHIGRPLVLAEWACEQGYEVHIATGAKGVALLKASGGKIPFTEIYTISGETFYQRVNQGKFFYTGADLENYVKAEIEIIREIQPDLIVSDFRLTTAVSARVMKVPLINLSNAYWSPHYECKFPAPQTGIFSLLPEAFKNSLFDLIRPLAFKVFGKPLNTIRKKYHLPMVDDFRTHYTAGDYTLYMDHPDFIKLKQPPFRHGFLGPVVWSPKLRNRNQTPEKKSLYITMGSSGNNQVLTQIAQACVLLDRKVIISGLNKDEAEKLFLLVPELRKNATVNQFVNAEEILPYCDLTICHGGSGTVYQSLASNTPVLCFPHNPDQGLVSKAVKDGNLGEVVLPSQLHSKYIVQSINRVLQNQSMANAVASFSKKLNSHETKERWLLFLSNLSQQSVTQLTQEAVK